MLSLIGIIFLLLIGPYLEGMEAIASFLILLTFYFLGCMAIVQLAIRPMRKIVEEGDGTNKHIETNHLKILALSFLLSLVTTTIAYMIFP